MKRRSLFGALAALVAAPAAVRVATAREVTHDLQAYTYVNVPTRGDPNGQWGAHTHHYHTISDPGHSHGCVMPMGDPVHSHILWR